MDEMVFDRLPEWQRDELRGWAEAAAAAKPLLKRGTTPEQAKWLHRLYELACRRGDRSMTRDELRLRDYYCRKADEAARSVTAD